MTAESERDRPGKYDWRAIQKLAHREFGRRLARVADWAAPTPDTEWDIKQLASHVIQEQQWAPLLLSGRTVREARSRLLPLAEDLPAEWNRYSTAAIEAWETVDLTSTVRLSRETVTADHFLREQVSDVVIHTWDLASAVHAGQTLDQELVEAAWSIFAPQKDTLEASGLFRSPIPIADDARLQTRLLALTGRDERNPNIRR
ncbi:MAG: TIGR03086 family metal-binding protein [Microbacteriaceae bacterium]